MRGLLITLTAASMGYQVVAALAARRWRRRAGGAEEQAGPPISVSVLKPVRGVDPHAEANFASFCVQEHPQYEVLFGVADPSDLAAEIVQKLAAQYPAVKVRLVETADDLGPNRKVCNLHGLAAAARHDLLLISD